MLSSFRIVLWLLPLLSADVSKCQDDAGYYSPSEEFDNCSEARVCSLPLYPDEELVGLLCRCDSNCTLYGDCCDSYVQSLDSTGTDVGGRLDGLLECRSIHLDEMTQPTWGESFWMVSACPADWTAGRDDQLRLEILNNCSRDSDDLPPVTDLQTGLVYKNEHCAVCHQVTSLIRWEYTFECHPKLSQLASQPNFTLTADRIQRWCLVCGFRKPNLTDSVVPAPRECVHHSLVIDSCLKREYLQPITEQLYQELVNQCKNGSYNPVVELFICPYPLRNQYCALCNGIQVSNKTLRCANPYHYQSSINYCYLNAQSISESVTPVTESAIPEPTMTTAQPSSTPTRFARAYHDPDLNGSKEMITDVLIPVANCEPVFDIGVVVPFTLFVDPNRNTQTITVGTKTVRFTTTCEEGEVFDHINNRCRKTACQEVAEGETCIITLFNGNISSTNGSLNDSFLCEEGSLIRLNHSEFTELDNETLSFGGEVYEVFRYINGSPVICTNLSQNGTQEIIVTVFFYSYPIGIIILTYVGCLLSVIGCVVVLLTYSLFKELRTLPGKILMNLSAAILATSLFLLAGIPLFALAEKEELCHMTAIFLHWLALSQFSWMTVMSCELARTMIRASRLRQTEAKKVKRNIFLIYLLIGWGTPTLVTGVSIIINYTTDYIQYGEDGFCWIGDPNSFYAVFLTPVTLSLLLNGVAFFITGYLLVKAQRGEAKLQKQQSTSYLRIHLSVFSITGLTWVFGFVAILARDDWAWYFFIILTSTQGFTICVAFLLTKKIFSLYKKRFWPMISSRFSLKSMFKWSTQNTSPSVALHSVGKGGNSSKESATPMKETVIGPAINPSEIHGQVSHTDAANVAPNT